MAGIVQAGQKLVSTVAGTATAAGKAVMTTGKSLVSGGGGLAGGVAGAANSVGGSALGWVTLPFTMIKGAFVKMPVLMTVGTGVTALYMLSGRSKRVAEQRARAAALQQQAQALQAQQQISYMNTVTPQETRAMTDKLEAKGAAAGGFAEAELAARASKAQESASAKA